LLNASGETHGTSFRLEKQPRAAHRPAEQVSGRTGGQRKLREILALLFDESEAFIASRFPLEEATLRNWRN